ncbi:hypothetical protein FDP41_009978 [Naegleria fowleri]|uniref:Uncharacterized protein n=1 Tax=Naegleria fowleri TaxID=5763 RepID=A0A6A5BC87_NAEFO|nr:uncharacterized protein FDP41_009978 [Naegleria fowleri]KAF0971755.1 hypothetical protein FDP41_009978 [Naegleria fowleri]
MHSRRTLSISITGIVGILTCLVFAGMASWGVYIYSSFHKYTFSTLRCDRISINIDMFCLSDEEKERTTLYTLVQMTSGFLILTMIGVMIAMASMLYTSVQLEVYSPL